MTYIWESIMNKEVLEACLEGVLEDLLKHKNVLEQAAKAIMSAKNIIITAGAGMGVDSGLPDFRGDKGFWKAYPPLNGIPFCEMANPEKFEENVRLAWGFYGHRLNLYRETVPHVGFSILQKWVKNRPYFIDIIRANLWLNFQ